MTAEITAVPSLVPDEALEMRGGAGDNRIMIFGGMEPSSMVVQMCAGFDSDCNVRIQIALHGLLCAGSELAI